MYQRRLTVRIVALLLVAAWAAVGLALLAGPRAAAAAEPLLVAWPWLPAALAIGALLLPARVDRPIRRRVLVGAGAILLAVALLVQLAPPDGPPAAVLLAVGPPTAYGAAVAVAATALFAGLGWVGGSHRAARATALATALAALAGGGLALAGSGGATGVCGVPAAATSARVEITAEASVDGRSIGRAAISGRRDAAGAAWTAELAGGSFEGFAFERVQLPDRAWQRDVPAGAWQPVMPDATIPALDTALVAVLAAHAGPGTEDLGSELIEGAPLRHCRRVVDGNAALDALPPLAWLVTAAPSDSRRPLGVWRGAIDWWVDADGVLVAASARFGGLPGDAWPLRGIQGLLQAELSVVDRGVPQPIVEPLP